MLLRDVGEFREAIASENAIFSLLVWTENRIWHNNFTHTPVLRIPDFTKLFGIV